MDQDGADLAIRRQAGGRLRASGAGPRLPRPVRAVVFDLDGTLLDTERAYRAAFLETVAAHKAVLPHGAYESLVGLPTPARRLLLPALLGPGCAADSFFDSYYAARVRHLAGGIAVKPGAMQLLAWLDAQRIPVAIATSASARTAAGHLDAAGLAGRFHPVVSRDDVARGKPAPDSYLQAAAGLGVPASDCLALEDSGHGVAAAHGAGMMVLLVPDVAPPAPETIRRCVGVLHTLADVRPLLETAPANDRSRSRV